MTEFSAFCPAYVTGIFTIGDPQASAEAAETVGARPLENDAAGAGFAIDSGLKTTVSRLKSGRTKIMINGSEAAAPVSKSVLRRYAEMCGMVGLLEIRHETEVPVGYGLGMSAAGALSLSLALNELLGAGFSRSECVKIAHDADVECGTGLSGVDAAAIGGILARRSISEKPVKLPFEEHELEVAFFSPIRTSAVIRDEGWKRKVNEAGEEALGMLFAEKNWGGLVAASRHFTIHSGLGNWCGGELDANPRASMAMLGQTLWSDARLLLSRHPVKTIKCTLRKEGAELV